MFKRMPTSTGIMLGQRRRRWPNIITTLVERLSLEILWYETILSLHVWLLSQPSFLYEILQLYTFQLTLTGYANTNIRYFNFNVINTQGILKQIFSCF